MEWIFPLLFVAGLWAGAQNALAGGGSFVTLPALMLAGLDPKTANLTSTVALFPGQTASGWAGRQLLAPLPQLSVPALIGISLLGGSLGALLLLVTSAATFARLVPWLVLFGTVVFAWGNFGPKRAEPAVQPGRRASIGIQFCIAIYGGYFGGGIGFLMLAFLTASGMAVRNAGGVKNALAAVINAAAVLLFAFSGQTRWVEAVVLGAGAVAGGLWGAWLLKRISVKVLRILIVAIGTALTVGLFLRS